MDILQIAILSFCQYNAHRTPLGETTYSSDSHFFNQTGSFSIFSLLDIGLNLADKG